MCTGVSPDECVQGSVLMDVYKGQSCRMCTGGSPAACVQGMVLQDVYRGQS